MMKTFDISTSALVAQRTRMDVIAGNIANAFTTRQADGTPTPYRRRFVEFMTGDGQGGAGVHVRSVEFDPSEFKLKHQPGHPQANSAGYVQMPNVSISLEMVDAMTAGRAYEANLAMLDHSKHMARRAIELFA